MAIVAAAGIIAVALVDQGGGRPAAIDEPPRGTTPASAPETSAPVSACEGASVEQRAGLVLVVALPGVVGADDPLVDRLAVTGVGGVMLRDENLLGIDQAEALVRGLRDRLGEDLLVAVDEEGGRVSSLRALGDNTPSARRVGEGGPEAAAQVGAQLGSLLDSIGVDWIFAPVLDLDDGPAGGLIGDRSYGSDPAAVAEAAGAFANALREAGVAVTLKHFPGHGEQREDPHLGVTEDQSTMDDLVRADLVPFQALIDHGAEAVMVSHLAYPRVWGTMPASLEPGAYDLLRSRGFDGVAVTDALGMGAIYNQWGFDLAPAMAIAAGADMALVNQGDRFEELVGGIVAAVARGDLSEERLDEAARRVLDLQGRDSSTVICAHN